MTHSITIKRAHLVALLTIAPKTEPRGYLETIRVEASGNDSARKIALVATDGALMQVIEEDNADGWSALCKLGDQAHGLMLARPNVERFVKATKDNDVELQIEAGDTRPTTYLLDAGGMKVDVTYTLGGRYPDWRQVLPMKDDPAKEPHYVNAALLAKAQKAIGLANGKSPAAAAQHVTAQLHLASLVQVQDNAEHDGWTTAVVLMPLRYSGAVRRQTFAPAPRADGLREKIADRKDSEGLQRTGTG